MSFSKIKRNMKLNYSLNKLMCFVQEMLIYFNAESERDSWVRAVTPSAAQVAIAVTSELPG